MSGAAELAGAVGRCPADLVNVPMGNRDDALDALHKPVAAISDIGAGPLVQWNGAVWRGEPWWVTINDRAGSYGLSNRIGVLETAMSVFPCFKKWKMCALLSRKTLRVPQRAATFFDHRTPRMTLPSSARGVLLGYQEVCC